MVTVVTSSRVSALGLGPALGGEGPHNKSAFGYCRDCGLEGLFAVLKICGTASFKGTKGPLYSEPVVGAKQTTGISWVTELVAEKFTIAWPNLGDLLVI
jgi:hypothetical protein